MPEISDRGRSPLPSMNLIESLEASFGLLFALLGVGRNATPSEIIINKFRTDGFQSVTILNKLSGKVLTVEDSSTNQGARIQQVPRNCAASQRWLFKRTEFIKHRIIPPVVDREILRYCPTVFVFPRPSTRSSRIIAGYVWTSCYRKQWRGLRKCLGSTQKVISWVANLTAAACMVFC
jgi:hypothetical protein